MQDADRLSPSWKKGKFKNLIRLGQKVVFLDIRGMQGQNKPIIKTTKMQNARQMH